MIFIHNEVELFFSAVQEFIPSIGGHYLDTKTGVSSISIATMLLGPLALGIFFKSLLDNTLLM